MVFESLIADLINKYLGDYIEALNASQLKLGLLGGNAHLENLDIKPNAFDEFNLPVKVLQGHISSLTLKIPFKNIYTEPTIAELDGLYALVVPNAAVRYDEIKEKTYLKEAKQKELRSIEEARAGRASHGKSTSKDDSFGEKLAAQIIKNLQVEIKNIHIRYEDSYSIPGQIFSVGLTLDALTFKTLNPTTQLPAGKEQSIREFFKMVKLTSLAVYWNHNSAVYSNKTKGPLRVSRVVKYPNETSDGDAAMLHIHMRPEETDYTVPQIEADIEFSEIELNFSLGQYHDVTSFLDATDRMITQSKYRKYRPQVLLNGNASIWWKYAYTSILEESIRRRHRMWSWSNISNHRRIVREYTALLIKQLRGEKLNKDQQKSIGEYEDTLDVFNIVLSRQQAELQAKSHDRRSKKKTSGGGLFGWFSRSSSATTDSTSSSSGGGSDESGASEVIKRLQTEMTNEEKARLYAAINYSETTGVSVGKLPTTYVSTVISVALNQLNFILLNEQLSDPRILKVAVNKLTANVEQRSGDEALSVKLRLDSLEALGAKPSKKQADLAKSSAIPVLITSRVTDQGSSTVPTQQSAQVAGQHGQLLAIDFEKNPIDRKADQRIHVRADPLQIVYDAETINKIVHFLIPPKELRLQELSSQMLSSLEDAKEVTVSGLRHLASRRAYTEVYVDVRPSYFILPDHGILRSDCRLLLVDLGSLIVRSTQTRKEPPSGDTIKALPDTQMSSNIIPIEPDSETRRTRKDVHATFDELKEGAYDKYEIVVSSVQVIMVEKDENWRELRTKDQSSNHILRPLGMNFNVKRCLLMNDLNLPKVLVDGCLPVFSLDLTDKVMKSLFDLVANVPFPEPDKRLTTPENPTEVLKDSLVLPGDNAASTRGLLRAARGLQHSTSQSTVGSWFSEDLEEEDEEEDDQDDDVENGEDALNLTDRQADSPTSTLDSGVEGDDLRLKANRASRRMQREAAIQRRRRANMIDLKAEFVIRMIQVQLLQRSSQPDETGDEVVLSLLIHEVGTNILKRRWDQEIHAHVGTLSVVIPSFTDNRTGEPVCLAKTKRHVEGHHLLALHLLIAEKNAPDFEKRYKNTRHHLRCEFKSLELCIHQESTVRLLDFFNSVLRDLVIGGEPVSTETQWAASIGDTEGQKAGEARMASQALETRELPDQLNAVEAIESHIARRNERRNIRLDAASEAAKSGNQVVIRDIGIIQWLINATLDKVTLRVCSNNTDILSTTIHGLRVDVSTTYLNLELSAILSEFSVTDMVEATDYRKVLWVDPAESIVSLQLTYFTLGTELPENACNPDKVDMSLSLQIGKMHMVFLNFLVMRLVDFMMAFQQQTKVVLNKVHELSDVAVQQVQEVVNKPSNFRLGLNIIAQAPVIYMPQHSFSPKALMIDLGQVTYENRFEFVPPGQQPSASSLSSTVDPIPAPGIMLEHTDIRLEHLRLSRAILATNEIKAEKRIVHPINLNVRLQRNLSPHVYTAIPLISVEGSMKSIHISICQGDYRVLQEIMLDNFAEIPPITVATSSGLFDSQSASLETPVITATSSGLLSSANTTETNDTPTPPPQSQTATKPVGTSSSEGPVMTAVQFEFGMEAVTLDLFSGELSMSEWHNKVPAEMCLALCTLKQFSVAGHVATDNSSYILTKLHDIQLHDTRVDAKKQITKILDNTGKTDDPDELIFVEFQQDASKKQKVHIKLRSIHLCASMDYMLALAEFQLKSTPQLEKKSVSLPPITEAGKRKRRDNPVHPKPGRRQPVNPPTEYPNELELKVEVGSPELVLVEDIYNIESNSLKVTAIFRLQYTVCKDVAVFDAAVKGLVVVACPYNEPVNGKFSKEIISPTELSFYSKQSIQGSMQGSIHMDSLLININPGTIQLLSKIVSSVQALSEQVASQLQLGQATSPTELQSPKTEKKAIKPSGSLERLQKRAKSPGKEEGVGMSIWDPVMLDELDLPYLRTDNSLLLEKSEDTNQGCDVSKVLEQMEDRRMDRFVVRLRTLRVVLESQVGTRSIPMIVLESSVDGEVVNPFTALELKFAVELSLSYYNDTFNKWEQLLETLRDEDDRMWSIQVELCTTNLDDLVASEDMEEVGCLQASMHTIFLVSRDNLELTLSKSALDMLSNLGRSFEAAYKQRLTESEQDMAGQLSAPYRIQNRTGLSLVLRTDPQTLQTIAHPGSSDSVGELRKSFAQSIRSQPNSVTLVRPIPTARPIAKVNTKELSLQTISTGTFVLMPGQEIGFTEAKRSTRKTLTLHSMTDKSPRHVIWTSWKKSNDQAPMPKSELPLPLHASTDTLLFIPRPLKSIVTQSTRLQQQTEEDMRVPVVAQVTTCLGMRVVNLRSTVQIVNDTSEPLCLYTFSGETGVQRHTRRLVTLEVGEIFSLPVEIVNSLDTTGLFLGPDVGVTTMSATAFYWPENACSTVNRNLSITASELIYLAPLADRSGSMSGSTLQPLSVAVANRPTNCMSFNWPTQLMECTSKASKLIYYYSVSTLHSTDTLVSAAGLPRSSLAPGTGVGGEASSAGDFQLIVRNSVVLHNQLPIAIHYILSDGIGEIEAGRKSTLRTVSPSSASIDVWFEYDGHVYRGKLAITPDMDELTAAMFESREGYELLTLYLGLRTATDLGQVGITLYAPYWMINKTGKDLTYKSTDDTEVHHPAAFSGALLYSSLAKSLFGKRKSPRMARIHSISEDETTEEDMVLVSKRIGSPSHESIHTIDSNTTGVSGASSGVGKRSKHWSLKRRSKSSGKTKTSRSKQGANQSRKQSKLAGKHKATVRIGDSAWSDKFSLDTVGSSGRVICKGKQKTTFELGVRINLSSSGLTKIVTLMPYFVLINKSTINLECCEVDDSTDRSQPTSRDEWRYNWIKVPAGEALPFWPQATSSKKMLLCCRINESVVTDSFPFYESYSILMRLPGKYSGIFVEVQTNEEATVITLQLYQEGMASVRVVNHLGDSLPVFFHQRGLDNIHQLEAGMSVMYTWDCTRAVRELVFYCNKNDKHQCSHLTSDSVEEFYVNDTKAYWVSFLWNMQRVLLFTQDMNAAKNARLSADLEKIDQEMIISLQSIGLSLVDNHNRAEVAYLSVTSSGVRWSQVRRGNRLKPLKSIMSESLERAYSSYVDQQRVSDEAVHGLVKLTDTGRPVEVDFSQMMMIQPDQCELRRAFEPGVFVQYKNSKSQMQLHAKIFRVQLDNQKMDCTFPVVLAPYPQTKSVALDSGPKPLIELSAVIARTNDAGSFRFKYFRVLIQEMLLKIDQGFLNDQFDFFSGTVAYIPEEEAFRRDCQLIENRLIDSPVLLAHLQEGHRSIFDNLHISPIKMHVSFSLTGSNGGKTTAFPSEVFNLFLQSIGIVLTDVQDVIFKLAYFERQACIMTVQQMTSDMTRHYVSQGIRQMYVLVLGLDVLGNPFGVLRGMAQGVEDLFYEPVKGAILGPEEFAEGVALGVKSLFGHAVGGAAGAVSRITGTIGKGVAALTLDEDYKRMRREQLSRRPDTFGAGIAQGGRGLVMGVFHGVTGVFTKPVDGAKKDGVEGFFKGVGKGLVGVVTRPVSGVVDFASSSFEGIRRIADSVEDVNRVRPPRFLRTDGVIRPYERHEAEGHLILRQCDKDNNYGQYVFHVKSQRGSNFMLLTPSHLLIVESMDLLGTWSVNWQTQLDALSEVPVVNQSGILITLKEKQKKRFTSGHQTRQFECDGNLALAMVREIDATISR